MNMLLRNKKKELRKNSVRPFNTSNAKSRKLFTIFFSFFGESVRQQAKNVCVWTFKTGAFLIQNSRIFVLHCVIWKGFNFLPCCSFYEWRKSSWAHYRRATFTGILSANSHACTIMFLNLTKCHDLNKCWPASSTKNGTHTPCCITQLKSQKKKCANLFFFAINFFWKWNWHPTLMDGPTFTSFRTLFTNGIYFCAFFGKRRVSPANKELLYSTICILLSLDNCA